MIFHRRSNVKVDRIIESSSTFWQKPIYRPEKDRYINSLWHGTQTNYFPEHACVLQASQLIGHCRQPQETNEDRQHQHKACQNLGAGTYKHNNQERVPKNSDEHDDDHSYDERRSRFIFRFSCSSWTIIFFFCVSLTLPSSRCSFAAWIIWSLIHLAIFLWIIIPKSTPEAKSSGRTSHSRSKPQPWIPSGYWVCSDFSSTTGWAAQSWYRAWVSDAVIRPPSERHHLTKYSAARDRSSSPPLLIMPIPRAKNGKNSCKSAMGTDPGGSTWRYAGAEIQKKLIESTLGIETYRWDLAYSSCRANTPQELPCHITPLWSPLFVLMSFGTSGPNEYRSRNLRTYQC